MRLTSTIILCLTVHIVFGQRYSDITKELEQFLSKNNANDTMKSWVSDILAHHDTAYLNRQFKTIPASKIKLVEVFDKEKSKYGLRETYGDSSRIESIFYDQNEDTNYNLVKANYKYPFEQIDTIKSTIVYFPPNTVEALCGCGQIPRKVRSKCVKEAERKARQDGFTSEPFARLITYIDKISGQIKFVLELPAIGKRQVYYGYSPDFSNRNWYN